MRFDALCSRRRFCYRLLGSLGILLSGGACPATAASPYGRSLAHFSPAKLPDALLVGSNPRLVRPHRQLQRFELPAAQRTVPGVIITTGGAPVRTVAPGIVHFIGQRSPAGSGSGGTYIRIAHDLYDNLKRPFYPRTTLYRYQAYRSTIYGLQSVRVKHWQSVQRGQIIGQAMPQGATNESAVKLVLEERGNPVNPDDYGAGHRFMHYGAEDTAPEIDLEEMHRRLDIQVQVIEKLNGFYADRSTDNIHKKIHGIIDTEKFTDYPVFWSPVEKLRYLEHRFRRSPRLFPGLSPTALDSLTRTFLENQPIVLTLPLTKPM